MFLFYNFCFAGGTIIGDKNKSKHDKHSEESEDSDDEDSDYDIEEFTKKKGKSKKENEKNGFEIVKKDYGKNIYILLGKYVA